MSMKNPLYWYYFRGKVHVSQEGGPMARSSWAANLPEPIQDQPRTGHSDGLSLLEQSLVPLRVNK
jgi:hypothetical protein